ASTPTEHPQNAQLITTQSHEIINNQTDQEQNMSSTSIDSSEHASTHTDHPQTAQLITTQSHEIINNQIDQEHIMSSTSMYSVEHVVTYAEHLQTTPLFASQSNGNSLNFSLVDFNLSLTSFPSLVDLFHFNESFLTLSSVIFNHSEPYLAYDNHLSTPFIGFSNITDNSTNLFLRSNLSTKFAAISFVSLSGFINISLCYISIFFMLLFIFFIFFLIIKRLRDYRTNNRRQFTITQ
ncbi:hypothetical protein MN116_000417, partial [Schistosoma mekongi]